MRGAVCPVSGRRAYKSGLKAQGCGKLKKAVFSIELDPDEEDETEE